MADEGVSDGCLRGEALTFTFTTLLAAAAAMAALATALLARSRGLRASHDALEQTVRERTEELRATQIEIISRLGAAAEWRDVGGGSHIERISFLVERLALAVGISELDAERLGHASAMHDIGKIGIPESVLLKPASLDATEWELMQTHTTLGAGVLAGSRSALVRLAETIALTHHERWDGSGYPFGLRGEKIPLAGRICAVCDVYDALTSKRPYKDAWTPEAALAEIERGSGSHFDPEIADAFLRIAPDLIAELEADAASPEPDTDFEDRALDTVPGVM